MVVIMLYPYLWSFFSLLDHVCICVFSAPSKMLVFQISLGTPYENFMFVQWNQQVLFIKPHSKHHNWIHSLQSYHLNHQFGVDIHLHVEDKTKYSHLAQCMGFKHSIGAKAKFYSYFKKRKVLHMAFEKVGV